MGCVWLLQGEDSDLGGAPWVPGLSSHTGESCLNPRPTHRGAGEGNGNAHPLAVDVLSSHPDPVAV